MLINGQVYYDRERVNVGYVTVLIIYVTQPHLIVEDVDDGDTHPWKIMDLRHNTGKSKF